MDGWYQLMHHISLDDITAGTTGEGFLSVLFDIMQGKYDHLCVRHLLFERISAAS